jgi:hypothetical protein
MNFERMYDGAVVTCSELVWQLGRSQRLLVLVLPSIARCPVGRVVAAAPNFFASACSIASGSRRSFAKMITHEGFVFHAATVSFS